MPDPNYISEIEREDGTILTIKDAEARAAIDGMDPTLQQILQGVNDIKSSIGDVGEIVEEVLVGPPTLIEKTITENGTYDASDDEADGYSSVTVDVSSGGGGTDVIFYDYDGTLVASYSAADFANLSAMPDNPTHTGLTAQGWNWSLADAKTYVAAYGKLNIGQMYVTSDGKTRFYFTVTKDSLTTELTLSLNANTELDVDWGDGSTHTTWTSNDGDSSKTHEYASAGRYVIAVTVITGNFSLSKGENDYILENLQIVECGNGVVGIDNNALSDNMHFTSITMPNSVTNIGNNAFSGCYYLKSLVIPNSVTSLGEYVFAENYALTCVTIPNHITSIRDGVFAYCYVLQSITMPDSVTSIGTEAFYDNHALQSITIPNNVTSIGYAAFFGHIPISSVIIPNSVTNIGVNAFGNCHALTSITFEPITPPELGGELGIPTTCIIRVPQGSLSAYTSASNYPDPSQYIYEEY